MFIRTPRSIVLLTGETCLLLAAVFAGTFVRLGTLAPAVADRAGILRVCLIVAVCQLCLHYADLYDLPGIQNIRELLVRLCLGVGASSLVLALLYWWFPRWMIGPG